MAGVGLNYGAASDAASMNATDARGEMTAKKSYELLETPRAQHEAEDDDIAQPDEAQQLAKAKNELNALYL